MSEMYPPSGGQGQGVPPAPAPPFATPPRPPKRTLHVGFAIAGFLTPWVVYAALTAFTVGVNSLPESPLMALLGPITGIVGIGTLLAVLIMFISGRAKGDDKLRSFGLGGLIAYAAMMLVALLAFGACLITLGSFGN